MWIELITPCYQELGLCWIIKDRKYPYHTIRERFQEQKDPSDHFLQQILLHRVAMQAQTLPLRTVLTLGLPAVNF